MLYDPLGLIGHVLIYLKVLLQEIWRSEIGWDEKIEGEFLRKWYLWLKIIPSVETVKIPRCFRVTTPKSTNTKIEMHTFVETSESGFAAVVYLRCEHDGIVECTLAGAKTRVTPLKFLSIQKSELQAPGK
ncbi:uncharacterized protein LOC131687762 [Topomyia yanbarensis]|uniref:uncharacterized protein LOC131687762 n=1 Tax=Topomyia yanbarensis TaxID=2498891 RepID=UPI00273C0563|nr:uncharacterized protein LOC131687762 [Topomyia yanbarensis]